eukprot:GHVU01075936.1.p2 GENE.GHVU01075936.1~~GHVU01075936.1.p2  ORF type:complete len:113 (+),score=14.86 GHVU01075936.1:38-340(+)
MANIVLSAALGLNEGIAVDTHVHRISNRLHWVKTKTPIETEKELVKVIPRFLWKEINVVLVGFGQQRCSAVKPKCGDCMVMEWCPFGKKAFKGHKPNAGG